jgi:hypothetical protein
MIALSAALLVPLLGTVAISNAVPSVTRTIEIQGETDGKPASFKNSLWLQANEKVPQLSVLPSDLKEVDNQGRTIQASNVHLTFVPGLDPWIPKELSVSVDSPFLQGQFLGSIVFYIPGAEKTDIAAIPLKLTLTEKPVLVSSPSTLTFRSIRCRYSVTCFIDNMLLRRSDASKELAWKLINRVNTDVKLSAPITLLHGDKTGGFPELGLSEKGAASFPTLIKGNTTKNLEFRLDQNTIRADHYQGEFRVKLGNAETWLVIPSTLDVRDGGLLPLVFVLLGILLGRFVQSANSPTLQAQQRLFEKYNVVLAWISRVTDHLDRDALALRACLTRIDIGQMAKPESEISADLDSLRRLASASEKLSLLESRFASADPAVQPQLASLLSSGRTFIRTGDWGSAEQQIARIESVLAPGAPILERTAILPTAIDKKPGRISRLLASAVGSHPVSGEWFYRTGRPLMFFLLLVLLALTGFYNLYVRSPTFGSDGYFDYLSLILWGLSADVAQKTLQSLSLNRAP